MRPACAVLIPWLLLPCCSILGPVYAGEADRPVEKKPAALDLEMLIRQLGAGDFAARERATRTLSTLADREWKQLRKHAQGTNPEIRSRILQAMKNN